MWLLILLGSLLSGFDFAGFISAVVGLLTKNV